MNLLDTEQLRRDINAALDELARLRTTPGCADKMEIERLRLDNTAQRKSIDSLRAIVENLEPTLRLHEAMEEVCKVADERRRLWDWAKRMAGHRLDGEQD